MNEQRAKLEDALCKKLRAASLAFHALEEQAFDLDREQEALWFYITSYLENPNG